MNNLNEIFQLAYKTSHSTETALLKISSDTLNEIDDRNVRLLTLLDLSAVFDTIDHDILICRLNETYGIKGSALSWIESYISERLQSVKIGAECSDDVSLGFGVLQGSVVGPIIFTLYTHPLAAILQKHDI